MLLFRSFSGVKPAAPLKHLKWSPLWGRQLFQRGKTRCSIETSCDKTYLALSLPFSGVKPAAPLKHHVIEFYFLDDEGALSAG